MAQAGAGEGEGGTTQRTGIVLNINNSHTATVVVERKKNAGAYSEVTRLKGGGSWYFVDLLSLTTDTYTYRTWVTTPSNSSSYSNEVSGGPSIIGDEYRTQVIQTVTGVETGVTAGTGIAFSTTTALAGDAVGSVGVDQTYVHPSASYALTASYALNGGSGSGGGISNTGSFSGSFTGSIKARGVGTSTTAIRTYLQDSNTNYWEIRTDGSQYWGPGTPGAYDISFSRPVAGKLQLTGDFIADGQITASEGFSGDGSQVTGVISSSYADTAKTLFANASASFATTALTASYGGTFRVSGSLRVTGSIGVLTGSAYV